MELILIPSWGKVVCNVLGFGSTIENADPFSRLNDWFYNVPSASLPLLNRWCDYAGISSRKGTPHYPFLSPY